MKTLARTCMVLGLALLQSVASHAADPQSIDELKAHYKEVAATPKSMLADYTMTMNLAAVTPESPETQGMGEMVMEGTMMLLNDAMRMDMNMSMQMGEQKMDIKMDMMMDDAGMMHMLMDMNGFVQAMKMDTAVMKDLAEKMGVPEAALNTNTMGMGFMQNPSNMLDIYETMYTLEFLGKETLNGEEVFVVKATMNADTLEIMQENPLMAQQASMFKFASILYLGAQDGIMRKTTMGDFMTMTLSNIDLESGLIKEDMDMQIPAGVQVLDLTEMMLTMFDGDTESLEAIIKE